MVLHFKEVAEDFSPSNATDKCFKKKNQIYMLHKTLDIAVNCEESIINRCNYLLCTSTMKFKAKVKERP
jgi:hypothetical protein